MCRKIISAVMAGLSLGLLSGCEKNIPAETEQVSVTEADLSESVSAVTTSVTSGTVIFCDEEVFEEASAEIERSEFAKKAEENPAVNVDIITDELDIYDLSENLVGYFYAEYPEISGADVTLVRHL